MVTRLRTISLAAVAVFIISCEQEISPAQSDRFIKFYGNSLMDEARDVEILEDGSIAVCGLDSVAAEGKRMILVMTDAFGNLRPGFPKYYTEEGLQSGANALVVKRGGQGGFLLCGYVEKPAGAGDTIQKDLFLVRTSSDGQELWKKSFGSGKDESILHATARISSGFMLAGYQEKENRRDILVMGVTEEGDSIDLSLNIQNPSTENASARYILNTGNGYLCVCSYDRINNPGSDILILNLSPDLDMIPRILDDNLDEYAQCIVEEEENTYVVLGSRINPAGRSEIVVHLIETDGLLITNSVLLAPISDGEAHLYPRRIVKMPDGRFAIVGTRESAGGDRNMFLQFLLADYQVAGRLLFGSEGDQSGEDIALPPDGGIIMTGTNGYGRNSMISLVKTGESGEL